MTVVHGRGADGLDPARMAKNSKIGAGVLILALVAVRLSAIALDGIRDQRQLSRAEDAQFSALMALWDEIVRHGPGIKQLFRAADRCTQHGGLGVFDLLPLSLAVPPGSAWEPFRMSAHHLAWLMLAAVQQFVQGKSPAVFTAIDRMRAYIEATVDGRGRGGQSRLLKDEEGLFAAARVAVRNSGIGAHG